MKRSLCAVALVLLFSLTSSLTKAAPPILIDACDNSLSPILENVKIMPGRPATHIADTGYYTLNSGALSSGAVIYMLENVSSILVTAYSSSGNFATKKPDSGFRRGVGKLQAVPKHIYRLFWRDNLAFIVDEGNAFWRMQINDDMQYEFLPLQTEQKPGADFFGLTVLASYDGAQFQAVPSSLACEISGKLYRERHLAEIPPGARYIKLLITRGALLQGENGVLVSNKSEQPLRVSRTIFYISEPPPTSSSEPETPSGSSSSESEQSSGSCESQGSSGTESSLESESSTGSSSMPESSGNASSSPNDTIYPTSGGSASSRPQPQKSSSRSAKKQNKKPANSTQKSSSPPSRAEQGGSSSSRSRSTAKRKTTTSSASSRESRVTTSRSVPLPGGTIPAIPVPAAIPRRWEAQDPADTDSTAADWFAAAYIGGISVLGVGAIWYLKQRK